MDEREGGDVNGVASAYPVGHRCAIGAGAPLLLLAATIAAAVPVAFGCIRAVTTGSDVRYLWMAGAAILGSMAIVPGWRSGARPATSLLARGAIAVAGGAACAAAMAILQGARSVPSVALVALSFGLCTGAGAVFAMLARAAHRQGTA